jgi:hypothetical protein
VVIQNSLNELLELIPAVLKLHRLNVLPKEHEWEEEDESFRPVPTPVSTGNRSIPHNGEV